MDSDSQEFEPCLKNSSFFEGFTKAPRLNDKQKKLREDVVKRSQLQTKQTTLHQKLSNINQKNQNNPKFQFQSKEQIVKEKLLVQQNSKPKANKKYKKQIKQQQSQSNKDKKYTKMKKSFQQLKLIRPILKAVNQIDYTKPTPIQSLAIPSISMGRDVVASSITGSGKTAAFLIPILQRYFNAVAVGYIRTLILTPTRELAIQIYQQFQKLNKYTRLEAVLVIGASSLQKQQSYLRNNPQVVIGTPGRVIDLLINSRSIGMQNLQMIVLDEADKLLQLGFEAQIKQVMNHINPQVQTILFSATMGPSVNRLTSATTSKPIRISADPDNKTAQKLHQQMIKLRQQSQEYRQSVLLSILTNLYNQKKQCHRMAIILGLLGLRACQLHGNLSQTQRIQTFIQFKQGKFDFLLATDLASRGLDIKQVKTVINYQLPVELTRYIHRIGRTARAGNIGTSLTLCNDDQCLNLKKMSKKTGDKLFKLSVNETVIRQNIIKIGDLEKDIDQIIFEQRQERSLRKAQMQLKKVQNITQHRDQIYTRPKKEWFITQKQKKKIQQNAKKQAGIQPLQVSVKKKKMIFKRKKKNK